MSALDGWMGKKKPDDAPAPAKPVKRPRAMEKLELDPVEEETLKERLARVEQELAQSKEQLGVAWEMIKSRDQEIENLRRGGQEPWDR